MVILNGIELVEHTFCVPLDHTQVGGPSIDVFAREVRAAEPGADAKPWLVFLQGGPGFESPRPTAKDGWIGEAVRHYRVLLLDQRGTGRSTVQVTKNIIEGRDAAAQAAHLAHFRADSIVQDCELIRRELGVERWSLLGQSFGGFCCVHYLSVAPDGLREVMITGGLPGLENHADDVYRRTYVETRRKNERMLRTFPELGPEIVRVAQRIRAGDVVLPGGDPLTLERFQTIGAQLGFSTGAAGIRFLVERAFAPGSDDFTPAFLRGVETAQAFDTNPFYATLHEACYAQSGPATNWSAERVRSEFPDFDAAAALDAGSVPLLTGEMVYPWYFEEIGGLRDLMGAADLLAKKSDWPDLYRLDVLAKNTVPVAAAIYYDDMFVPTEFSVETARQIRGAERWVTSEFEHDGLRAGGAAILARLRSMLTHASGGDRELRSTST